jgi:hypothetical protein
VSDENMDRTTSQKRDWLLKHFYLTARRIDRDESGKAIYGLDMGLPVSISDFEKTTPLSITQAATTGTIINRAFRALTTLTDEQHIVVEGKALHRMKVGEKGNIVHIPHNVRSNRDHAAVVMGRFFDALG